MIIWTNPTPINGISRSQGIPLNSGNIINGISISLGSHTSNMYRVSLNPNTNTYEPTISQLTDVNVDTQSWSDN
jgi:hypothetical protein